MSSRRLSRGRPSVGTQLLRALWQRWGAAALAVIAGVSVAGNVLQYFHASAARPLVKVGPRVVRQQEYLADLDAVSGRAVLERLVYGELVRQAADRAGVFPTPAQVDARLAGRPPGTDREAVALQIALENLRLQGTTATDAQVAAYYAAHKAGLAAPTRVTTSVVVTHDSADAARAARLLAAGRTEAEIAALPRMQVAGVGGFQIRGAGLTPDLRARLLRAAFAPPLGVVRTLAGPGGTFYIVEPHRREGGGVPPLDQVRGQVTRLVRLQEAPSERAELAELYRASPPTFEMSRYAQFFADGPDGGPAAPPASGAP